MRICGEKYATCGPNTATGCPLADSAPETTSALDIARCPLAGGNRPSSSPARPVREAPAPLVAATTLVRFSEPASAIAAPSRAGLRGGVW